jgi:Ni/Fe-hydrogenase subunit HybB-like protein
VRTYIPSWQELFTTFGLMAFGFTAFALLARYFNVFGEHSHAAESPAETEAALPAAEPAVK